MKKPYLVLADDPPLTLLLQGDDAPGLSYPLITGIGAIRRPSDGSETGNVTIDLDNADGALSTLWSVPPLGVGGTLYGPAGDVWFKGAVASVSLSDKTAIALVA